MFKNLDEWVLAIFVNFLEERGVANTEFLCWMIAGVQAVILASLISDRWFLDVLPGPEVSVILIWLGVFYVVCTWSMLCFGIKIWSRSKAVDIVKATVEFKKLLDKGNRSPSLAMLGISLFALFLFGRGPGGFLIGSYSTAIGSCLIVDYLVLASYVVILQWRETER